MNSYVQIFLLTVNLTVVQLSFYSQDSKKPQVPNTSESSPPPAVEELPDAWKVFSAAQGRFTVLFPGTPIYKDNSSDTAGGRVENHEYSLKTTAAFYAVSYTDFPVDVEKEAAIRKQVLDSVRDIVVSKTKSRILSEEDILVQGHPGRLVELATPNGGVMRVKRCAVGKRMYQVMVITPQEIASSGGSNFDETRTKKFLDSFKLVTIE